MIPLPPSFEKLLALLRTLPSVGPKMSERIAFHLLRLPEDQIREFISAVQETYRTVRPCSICGYWDDDSPCRICGDDSRDKSVLCVVEGSQDIQAIGRVRKFNGLFHVLGGILSPLDGVGPQDLEIDSLLRRLENEPIGEVILALNPDMEGETTCQYIAKRIQALSQRIKITRPAQGLPVGGELEYMDELTLTRALEGRRDVS
ncbi:MAG: recombination protein RecR [Elusimicrobia bacterium RIFCSPLOWO2_01_FULL_64_13]|nr:MAG: recombination protein RecR [Elusimicrobia bacterium RIFCSPLOWO2_01_FULL_64_13]